jgi:hypothetical protein
MSASERIAVKAEEHTGKWDVSAPYKSVLMEKVVADSGKKRVGEWEEYTYKSLSDDQARQRAVKALKRIGEDPLHWKVVS